MGFLSASLPWSAAVVFDGFPLKVALARAFAAASVSDKSVNLEKSFWFEL